MTIGVCVWVWASGYYGHLVIEARDQLNILHIVQHSPLKQRTMQPQMSALWLLRNPGLQCILTRRKSFPCISELEFVILETESRIYMSKSLKMSLSFFLTFWKGQGLQETSGSPLGELGPATTHEHSSFVHITARMDFLSSSVYYMFRLLTAVYNTS